MPSTTPKLRPVLLVGGTGTRLWPLSRGSYPKQFLPLLGDLSPLQATCERVKGLDAQAPIFVANEEHRFIVAEQLRQIGQHEPAILLEPAGRNTAPAIALAALLAQAEGDDPVLLVLPSDHAVTDAGRFQEAVRQALPAALDGRLVTFGIQPTYAETGYGYIRAGAVRQGVADVEAFVEKPDAATAEQYLASGRYFWNSGMFLFRASRYLQALQTHRPDILAACRQAMARLRHDGDFIRLDEAAFAACPADSIDYAVMERDPGVAMVPLDAGWSDIGSFASLWQLAPQDRQGNALRGDVIAEDCRNVYAYSSHRLLALLGLEDVVVVETADAVLVAARDKVQDVRRIVARLNAGKRAEASAHRLVYRPWGSYDAIDGGERFQVKRIRVAPGARLSLQMHHHRAEHWIVVTGTARVTRGDEVFLLSENQSAYIPLGVKHRLENPGSIDLELIEVQSGPYLGEDDIVRFDDAYGR
ncbi:mannose-1-phosphate guanylyltransferase/mannose-6-phosphate isomerase [Bordetella pseudohinzii]|uniref:mannose-1-phosphate guanylyltransferase n=1 Tax=Bordetella pseudohinzii TaxID=1331258 RepID=A0A0J6BUG0_9BORD|nr:mannose-1-phosphate guanylyltransferase/mannose-6-phosphate isomerase [Bordetella pseudohinzii]ANY16785.1 mannose-1-phosphate guanylyltransferase/mannose-6-phosphate isomerase [Bordetella pseudohinzii]KMM25464.1 mannose-1-phosphate guanyltransferase [Bordetella pseudohinzii]KXA76113.1 mannose-1-phosphate guanyltransferase [Bordetella pseudohinzii]KXA78860.1 mannose-1-phosphate guanyltransferase [Bordetella pseudohinzii]CUI91171.1 Alginate biosynthesis protein AlgA [Bordetella pseudohinzii]